MRLLGIECLGDGVSMAVSSTAKKIVLRKVKARRQDEVLTSTMDAALKAAKTTLQKIDAIVVANGPGRFTSTRIAVTYANTIAWSIGKPVVAVTLFEAFAFRLTAEGIKDGTVVLGFPALRGEAYVQTFKWKAGACKALDRACWVHSAPDARMPEKPITAADLLGVAVIKLSGGVALGPVEPLYLKPANYLKK
ncbi:MAG: tRNA (adenosine(37)-N6)-threonylcarbamoyltransferase complex dimerization subunit type 1 TsaB [Elusimicrobia bacterium]|nr:MAG: tRNA (adenosine(37)-N6)-threonylcarbamoyltransferase complex dimerization subunit type 1 TsaB [Elusimicrobiota bacterium]